MYIFALIIAIVCLYYLIFKILEMPGCSGNCMQGNHPCDCPLGKKNDIQ